MADNPVRQETTEVVARENLRLARRVARLELLLTQVEQIRDGNERLLSRVMDDLDAGAPDRTSSCSTSSRANRRAP